MKIAQICAELAPIAQAGGLGEVTLGLSRELVAQGHDVILFLPKYRFINNLDLSFIGTVEFHIWKYPSQANLWKANYDELQLILIDLPEQFDRDLIYGYPDDVPRFIYFCKAVSKAITTYFPEIKVAHLHDWHTAAISSIFKNENSTIKTILTLHNLEHQGKCGAHDLQSIELPLSAFLDLNSIYKDSYNLLLGGIREADLLTTVSPTYAKEILQSAFGLEKEITQNKHKLKGILNGLDQKLWNPQKDPYLSANFSKNDPLEIILQAKRKSKELLLPHVDPTIPWIGSITRLATQKAPELIEEAINFCLNKEIHFFLLGSQPNQEVEQRIFDQMKSNSNISARFEFSPTLSHQLFAALDFLLIPSHFEPCGLTQMIAMRYGTIPIGRATGGLIDTINNTNGYLFDLPNTNSMLQSINQALYIFHSKKTTHEALIKTATAQDFGWENPAKEYLKLYQFLKSLK
jgi:starch synthase